MAEIFYSDSREINTCFGTENRPSKFLYNYITFLIYTGIWSGSKMSQLRFEPMTHSLLREATATWLTD